ncbi:MAG: methylmalonyl-CoA mutase family protein [Rikenellaceae bacterium]
MASCKDKKLFEQFPPVSTEHWEEVIKTDLKGADYDRKLVWKTAEGFNVRPYYRAEDLANVNFLDSKPGEAPFVRGAKKEGGWLINQTIVVECPKTGNETAKNIIERGVEALGFNINNKEFSAEDLETLLDGIAEDVEISFCGCAVRKVAELVIARAQAKNTDPENLKINFVIDPIIKGLTLEGKFCDQNKCFESIAELIKQAGTYGKRMRFISITAHNFNMCGATIVQELAYSLAVAHEYVVKLMELGLDVDQASPAIRFNYSVGSNYFMEIAKLRAARLLWSNIMTTYNPKRGCSHRMKLHALTSKWNQTVYDPYVNMLRATTEAMSAAIAGVHSLDVTPFNAPYEKATDFSLRIARNIQLLLKKESHFDAVADPSGGSYYIENLTQSIADQAWALFKEIEDKGGYIAAFESGYIKEQVDASAAKRRNNIATRRETLLGTNQFPNFTETLDSAIIEAKTSSKPSCICSCSDDAASKALVVFRGAEEFEALRMKFDSAETRPQAFMLTCGSLSFARARAQFACNFFACAGIQTVDNTYFKSVEEGAKAALDAKADIVVICASDDDYATLALEAKQLLGDKAIFVVAGAPACTEELKAQGIENFISVKSNVLETLRGYASKLGL